MLSYRYKRKLTTMMFKQNLIGFYRFITFSISYDEIVQIRTFNIKHISLLVLLTFILYAHCKYIKNDILENY